MNDVGGGDTTIRTIRGYKISHWRSGQLKPNDKESHNVSHALQESIILAFISNPIYLSERFITSTGLERKKDCI